jgi:hypothetical protein
MNQHLTILAALFIGLGALGFLGAIVFMTIMVGGGLLSGDHMSLAITSGVGAFVAGIILLTSIPQLIAGWGIYTRKRWAKILTMIVAALDLLSIPIGTALGIYALWVMTRPETETLLS